MSIHFGTSGWRAIIADEFTFANLKKVCQAIIKYVQNHHLQKRGIIVSYDTRFLSKQFAQACAEVIASHKIKAFLTDRDSPTPVIAYHIIKKKTAGAINITASHNPPEYNGIKFSPSYGGPASLEVTEEIERNIKDKISFSQRNEDLIQLFDPRPAYFQRIKQLVNFDIIHRAHLKIGVDVLYGTGRGYLDRLLQGAGCQITVLHNYLDPLFGGWPPEPAQEQLEALVKLVRRKRLHLGLAVDGDADRFGIVDRDGTYIGANQIIALLTAHLASTRPKQKRVARTVATTHMVDALAEKYGLEVVETPVGFKYIGQEIARGGCLIGGEESGGLSIVGHVPEKDGILACLLIAEMVATRKKPLGQILQQLYREVGTFLTARTDFHLREQEKIDFLRRIELLSHRPFLLDKRVVKFVGGDGYKFIFADGSWMMLRSSGTEPVVRCYCEAHSKIELEDLQKLGQRIIKRAI